MSELKPKEKLLIFLKNEETKMKKYSYLTPKVEVRSSSVGGKGVFAKENIKKGELIAIWGGRIMTLRETKKFSKNLDQTESLQVYDNFFLSGLGLPDGIENVDFFNHSCSPNIGVKGQIILVAMRNIAPGEELTFDYATTETQDVYFKCNCGSKNCRGFITKNDWKRPDLQKKYREYFSWYIQEKIRSLNKNRDKK